MSITSMSSDALEALYPSVTQMPPALVGVVQDFMTKMEGRDPRLGTHGRRTSTYALAIGHVIGLSDTELVHLHCAALLHDIGKLALPREMFDKDGPFTAEEYALVQSHPRAGAMLLAATPSLQVPAVWIAHHHERWDGCGYPYGLRGSLIPLGSRVLAVADTFDALTSPCAFRPARDPASAIRLLQFVAGSQLDPTLVDTFTYHTLRLLDAMAGRSSKNRPTDSGQEVCQLRGMPHDAAGQDATVRWIPPCRETPPRGRG
jgi:HD-GYP domain-containing protein (c-di-GMP phosphodiesterase class II)